MKIIILVLCIIAALVFIYWVASYRSLQKLKKRIRDNWGRVPQKSRNDKIDSVCQYWIKRIANNPIKYYVDNITWNDLDMDKVFKRVNSTYSSVGSEYLYARLHEPSFDMHELNNFEELLQQLTENQPLRENISVSLARLGKEDYNGVCEFIYSPADKKLQNGYMYYLLALLPVALLILSGFVTGLLGLAALACAINLLIYYKKKSDIEAQLISINYIVGCIGCAGKLGKIKDKGTHLFLKNLLIPFKQLKKVGGFARSLLVKPVNEFAFLVELVKAIFLVDLIFYNRIIDVLCKNKKEFYELWKHIGELDTAISIASYRKSLDFYTIPDFTQQLNVKAENVYHPLLTSPVSNNVQLVRNAVITGSNASGKSTFVKTMAINIIFAQTIHTCLAKTFSYKPSLVITSMAVKDDISEGDSYFIAEIKSLKRILDKLNSEVSCICFIDEILKGTNTIERIAASVSILKWLVDKNCLCLVASHDIEISSMLNSLYDNYHFREQITDKGITFDYKIHDGQTTTRNAINLLDYLDFPEVVINASKACAEGFDSTQKWKLV